MVERWVIGCLPRCSTDRDKRFNTAWRSAGQALGLPTKPHAHGGVDPRMETAERFKRQFFISIRHAPFKKLLRVGWVKFQINIARRQGFQRFWILTNGRVNCDRRISVGLRDNVEKS